MTPLKYVTVALITLHLLVHNAGNHYVLFNRAVVKGIKYRQNIQYQWLTSNYFNNCLKKVFSINLGTGSGFPEPMLFSPN